MYSRIPDSDKEDLNEAVAAAKAAFPGWSETPAMERSKVMIRIAERCSRFLLRGPKRSGRGRQETPV